MFWNPFGLPPTRPTMSRPWKGLILAALLALALGGRAAYSAEGAKIDVHNPLRRVEKVAPQGATEGQVVAEPVIYSGGPHLELLVSTPENRVWQSAALRRLALLWGQDSVAWNAEQRQTNGNSGVTVSAAPDRFEQERGAPGSGAGKQGIEARATQFNLWLPVIPRQAPG